MWSRVAKGCCVWIVSPHCAEDPGGVDNMPDVWDAWSQTSLGLNPGLWQRSVWDLWWLAVSELLYNRIDYKLPFRVVMRMERLVCKMSRWIPATQWAISSVLLRKYYYSQLYILTILMRLIKFAMQLHCLVCKGSQFQSSQISFAVFFPFDKYLFFWKTFKFCSLSL